MKITDPGIIRRGEQELLDAIKTKLDWNVIQDLNKERFSSKNLECTSGDIVVHENQVAYKMEFEVRASFTLLFDREGNIIHQEGDAPITDSLIEETGSREEPAEAFTDADISDEAMADIAKELTEISDFHKEADDILASLGAEAEIGIPVKPSPDVLDGVNDPVIDESSLFEELALPPDDQLGVLEEITVEEPKNELRAALSKSQDFWLKEGKKSPEPKAVPIPEKDELKMAFQKSQSFWLRK